MEILGLTWHAWITVITVSGMFASLMFTKVKVDVAFLAAVCILYVTGVLDLKGAFGGFSSSSVLVVAVLFVVIAGLEYSGVLNLVVKNLMGTPKTLTGAIIRLMLPVAALSSMLSNTTVVALFINVVKKWCDKLGIPPSKLLIPLSYASGMGGICTLIGTPPNLIISGLYAQDTGVQMSIFTPTLSGLFCLTIGVLSTIAMQRFLPDRKSPLSTPIDTDFIAGLEVPSDSPYIGMTHQEMLKAKQWKGQPKGVKVMAIRRFDGEVVHPVKLDEFIMGGDTIFIKGDPSVILRISRALGFKSPQLRSILEAEGNDVTKSYRTALSAFILITMVLLSAFNVLPLLNSAIIAAFAMVICKCCNAKQAMRAIDVKILAVFAGSIAIGTAIEDTGLAQMITNAILAVCGSNPLVVLTCICFVGTFITEFISNTAAGAMFYPIAMAAASATGANPVTFCVALMISVSSSFATPIGSPTHTLVYTPGGYRFTDFMRLGLPMNIIILAANIFITTIIFPF